MDPRVERLVTSEECEQFALNVKGRLPELAAAAIRRGIDLRAAAYGATTDAERAAFEAVPAFERVLSQRRGWYVRATRTWQMIERYGVVDTVERLVRRNDDASGYLALVEIGMPELAFESVVVRHPSAFTVEAVARSRDRLARWPGHVGER
jgi:hypothetical protein